MITQVAAREPSSEKGTPPRRPVLADASQLHDRLPDWLKAPRSLAALTAVIACVFTVLCYQPLWHTDLWGHLAYGRFIWQSGAVPQTEPLMVLASGVRFVDTAWLSQLIAYGAFELFGTPALGFLYGAAIALGLAVLIGRTFVRTRHAGWAIAGGGLFLWVEWQQLLIVRPQLAGLVCFVIVFSLLSGRRWRRAYWATVPAMFVLWANLHGSFPVGLAVLACFCGGRALDVMRRTRRISAVVADERVRRYFVLAQLAAVAVLVNPYGLALYGEVLSFWQNANLADLVEWGPLTLRMRQGQAAAVAALALMLVYAATPRRISLTEPLLLCGLGAAALWSSRMIVWWAPVAAYFFTLHGHAAWNRFRRARAGRKTAKVAEFHAIRVEAESADSGSRGYGGAPRSGKWTVVTAGLVWIVFAYSPLGLVILHAAKDGDDGSTAQRLSPETPVGAARYLTKHPPVGQVFNTYEFGDYLLWAGPRDMPVFVASHAHLVPREVWQHYMQVISVASGWEEILANYGVNMVVLDIAGRGPLIRRLRRSDEWRVGHEDEHSIVFIRREPIGKPAGN